MEQTIASMQGHVIICGWGRGPGHRCRAGRAGRPLVAVDLDQDSQGAVHAVVGDATEDDILRRAGIERAAALAAAADSDVATSSRSALGPEPGIVHRGAFPVQRQRRQARPRRCRSGGEPAEHRGCAHGGVLVSRPHVAAFLDVVMHERTLEFRLEEVPVETSSPLVGRSLREATIRDRTACGSSPTGTIAATS